jgi:hypothetical protein
LAVQRFGRLAVAQQGTTSLVDGKSPARATRRGGLRWTFQRGRRRTALAVRLAASISSTQAQGENNTSRGSSSLEGVQAYPIRLVNWFMSK